MKCPGNKSNVRSKVPKLLKDLEKSLIEKSPDKHMSLDRLSFELNRMISKSPIELDVYRSYAGLSISIKLLEQLIQTENELNSSKSILNLINLLTSACENNKEICCEIMFSNKIVSFFEFLNFHCGIMKSDLSSISYKSTQKHLIEWTICSELILLINIVFENINKTISNDFSESNFPLINRTYEILSLLVSFRFIDLFSVFFNNIRGPLEGEAKMINVLQNCLYLLISTTRFLMNKHSQSDIFSKRKVEDTSHLLMTFKTTNLVNIVSMLYGMLHKDASTPIKYDTNGSAEQTKKKQPLSTLDLTTLALKFLNQMITLDFYMVQVIFVNFLITIHLIL